MQGELLESLVIINTEIKTLFWAGSINYFLFFLILGIRGDHYLSFTPWSLYLLLPTSRVQFTGQFSIKAHPHSITLSQFSYCTTRVVLLGPTYQLFANSFQAVVKLSPNFLWFLVANQQCFQGWQWFALCLQNCFMILRSASQKVDA